MWKFKLKQKVIEKSSAMKVSIQFMLQKQERNGGEYLKWTML